jgi:hypothetical protein
MFVGLQTGKFASEEVQGQTEQVHILAIPFWGGSEPKDMNMC